MQNVLLVFSIFVGLMLVLAAFKTAKSGDKPVVVFLTTVLMLFLASCFFTGAILYAIDILAVKLK